MPPKISFLNDYSELAHPRLMEAMQKAALEANATYGLDKYSKSAEQLIRKQIRMDADVHFVVAGTLANLLCLGAILRPYESIIACDSGHINVHEAGAVEATGHKIHAVKNNNGKLSVQDIRTILEEHMPDHCALPRVVYISQATELGSLYSKEELFSISDFCRKNGLYLYLDGARLGSALTAQDNDLTLEDIAKNVDIFYMGGTKNGAPLGEAVVIPNDRLRENFRYSLKQRGAMLAKGSVLGIFFTALFEDGLYWDLARHANAMAQDLVERFRAANISFKATPQTNQIFPILPEEVVVRLEERFLFHRWEKASNNHTVIRLVTSWATRPESVAALGQAIHEIVQGMPASAAEKLAKN